MKKTVIFILSVLLIMSFSIGLASNDFESIDFSNITTEQLLKIKEQVDAELERRTSNGASNWPSDPIMGDIPCPIMGETQVVSLSSAGAMIYVKKITLEAYEIFVEGCKTNGYTKNVTAFGHVYNAYNESGHSMQATYSEDTQQMTLFIFN